MIQYPLGVDGVLTRVLEAGAGDRTMLLVHGVGARADRWRRNLEGLASAGYHPYAIDLPGHGLAQKGPNIPGTVPEYARFARGMLDELGAGEVYLIGTSLGGHVCATAACDMPERVAGLVLVGTVGITPIGAERRQRTQSIVGETSWEAIGGKLRVVLHDEALATEELQREEFRINNSPGAAESFRAHRRLLRQRPRRRRGRRPAGRGSRRFPGAHRVGPRGRGLPAGVGRGDPGQAARLAAGSDGRCRPRPVLRAARGLQPDRHRLPGRPPGRTPIEGVELR